VIEKKSWIEINKNTEKKTEFYNSLRKNTLSKHLAVTDTGIYI